VPPPMPLQIRCKWESLRTTANRGGFDARYVGTMDSLYWATCSLWGDGCKAFGISICTPVVVAALGFGATIAHPKIAGAVVFMSMFGRMRKN
jgi:hypothetical protein